MQGARRNGRRGTRPSPPAQARNRNHSRHPSHSLSNQGSRLSMIRESMPSGSDPTGALQSSLAQTQGVCENIIPDQKSRTRWRLNLIPSRPSAPPNSLSQLTGDQTCRKRIPYEIGRIAISRDRTIVAPEGDKCISTSWRPHGVTSCLLPPDSSSIDRAAATTHSYNRVHPARSKGCLPTFGDPQ